MIYVKLYVHSLVDKLKWFYKNARCYNKIYTICCIYIKLPPDDEYLIYSKHLKDRFFFLINQERKVHLVSLYYAKIKQCKHYVILGHVRVTIIAVEKAITIIYFECMFLAIIIQHEKRMRHIFICGLSVSTILFPHYLINGTVFKKTAIEHKKCVLIFSTRFVCSISHCKKNSARYYHKSTLVLMWSTVILVRI